MFFASVFLVVVGDSCGSYVGDFGIIVGKKVRSAPSAEYPVDHQEDAQSAFKSRLRSE